MMPMTMRGVGQPSVHSTMHACPARMPSRLAGRPQHQGAQRLANTPRSLLTAEQTSMFILGTALNTFMKEIQPASFAGGLEELSQCSRLLKEAGKGGINPDDTEQAQAVDLGLAQVVHTICTCMSTSADSYRPPSHILVALLQLHHLHLHALQVLQQPERSSTSQLTEAVQAGVATLLLQEARAGTSEAVSPQHVPATFWPVTSEQVTAVVNSVASGDPVRFHACLWDMTSACMAASDWQLSDVMEVVPLLLTSLASSCTTTNSNAAATATTRSPGAAHSKAGTGAAGLQQARADAYSRLSAELSLEARSLWRRIHLDAFTIAGQKQLPGGNSGGAAGEAAATHQPGRPVGAFLHEIDLKTVAAAMETIRSKVPSKAGSTVVWAQHAQHRQQAEAAQQLLLAATAYNQAAVGAMKFADTYVCSESWVHNLTSVAFKKTQPIAIQYAPLPTGFGTRPGGSPARKRGRPRKRPASPDRDPPVPAPPEAATDASQAFACKHEALLHLMYNLQELKGSCSWQLPDAVIDVIDEQLAVAWPELLSLPSTDNPAPAIHSSMSETMADPNASYSGTCTATRFRAQMSATCSVAAQQYLRFIWGAGQQAAGSVQLPDQAVPSHHRSPPPSDDATPAHLSQPATVAVDLTSSQLNALVSTTSQQILTPHQSLQQVLRVFSARWALGNQPPNPQLCSLLQTSMVCAADAAIESQMLASSDLTGAATGAQPVVEVVEGLLAFLKAAAAWQHAVPAVSQPEQPVAAFDVDLLLTKLFMCVALLPASAWQDRHWLTTTYPAVSQVVCGSLGQRAESLLMDTYISGAYQLLQAHITAPPPRKRRGRKAAAAPAKPTGPGLTADECLGIITAVMHAPAYLLPDDWEVTLDAALVSLVRGAALTQYLRRERWAQLLACLSRTTWQCPRFADALLHLAVESPSLFGYGLETAEVFELVAKLPTAEGVAGHVATHEHRVDSATVADSTLTAPTVMELRVEETDAAVEALPWMVSSSA